MVDCWKRTGVVPEQKVLTLAKVILGSALLLGFVTEDFSTFHGQQVRTKILADPWWMGPVGWVLDDIRPLATPVACRGFQKLWRPEPYTQQCALLLGGF